MTTTDGGRDALKAALDEQLENNRRMKARVAELEAHEHGIWGGGRESGASGLNRIPEGQGEAMDSRQAPAANPAAHKPHGLFTSKNDLLLKIRALEDAERTCKAANESQRKSIRALEAELAEARQRETDLHLAWASDRKERDALKAEVERLKAEIRRLERILETDHDENCKWRVAEIGKLHAEVERLTRKPTHEEMGCLDCKE